MSPVASSCTDRGERCTPQAILVMSCGNRTVMVDRHRQEGTSHRLARILGTGEGAVDGMGMAQYRGYPGGGGGGGPGGGGGGGVFGGGGTVPGGGGGGWA